ncbi:hypothetical protein HNY73_017669 [Argiope bruennichi]|uniref:Uncharacterized protein n=1 Tax=Argiope bruennichi TaxID=94029 RepID=A0A8T0EBM0_ARGBR|nr:hypothetical protein HNY73_017669 [Argiope bruennichi]
MKINTVHDNYVRSLLPQETLGILGFSSFVKEMITHVSSNMVRLSSLSGYRTRCSTRYSEIDWREFCGKKVHHFEEEIMFAKPVINNDMIDFSVNDVDDFFISLKKPKRNVEKHKNSLDSFVSNGGGAKHITPYSVHLGKGVVMEIKEFRENCCLGLSKTDKSGTEIKIASTFHPPSWNF